MTALAAGAPSFAYLIHTDHNISGKTFFFAFQIDKLCNNSGSSLRNDSLFLAKKNCEHLPLGCPVSKILSLVLMTRDSRRLLFSQELLATITWDDCLGSSAVNDPGS